MLKARVEGFIVCLSQETYDYSHFEQIIESEIPLVFFDRVCLRDKVPTVTADNYDAARRITNHFYENNARRIAFISGPEHLNISTERESGYLRGLSDCGLELVPEYIGKCDLTILSASKATQRLLSLSNPPDAIFGVNDTVVFAAMKEIKIFGMRIPEDILLAGFIDEFHATLVEPNLTSVMHSPNEMGKAAADLLFELDEFNGISPKSLEIITTLEIRESSLRKIRIEK